MTLRKTTRAFLFTALFSLILILLAACGSTQTTESDAPAPQSDTLEAEVSEDVVEAEPATPTEAQATYSRDDPPKTSSEETAGQEKLLLSAEDAQAVEIERNPEVPELPFPDNPDPALCGIPQQWSSDDPAYLTGIYEGELIQPTVFLYDSHLRREVVGSAPHGAEVKILLSQSNPTLDYFLVKVINAEEPTEGWIPAPFVTFEPPPESAQAILAPATGEYVVAASAGSPLHSQLTRIGSE